MGGGGGRGGERGREGSRLLVSSIFFKVAEASLLLIDKIYFQCKASPAYSHVFQLGTKYKNLISNHMTALFKKLEMY